MILKSLLELIYGLFSLLTIPIQIATMPAEVTVVMAKVSEAFVTGVQILGNYVDISYLLILFGLVVAVDVGLLTYHFVMWIIKKIPMLGIE